MLVNYVRKYGEVFFLIELLHFFPHLYDYYDLILKYNVSFINVFYGSCNKCYNRLIYFEYVNILVNLKQKI